jgi:hypothetical protein
MEQNNYYVDGKGFKTYDEARIYADELLVKYNIYKCIYTKEEWEKR